MAASIRLKGFIPCLVPNAGVYSVIIRLGKHVNRHRIIYRCLCSSSCSTNAVSSIITRDSTVDKSVAEKLKQELIGTSGHTNYRKHPGVMIEKNTQLPVRLVKAMQILFEKYPVKTLSTKVEKLLRYLHQRQLAVTEKELAEKTRIIESKILEKDRPKLEDLNDDEQKNAMLKHKNKIITRLRRLVYHWKPMQYDAFTSYVYLLGRTASDYSVLLQTYTEISKRDADFKPTTIFHYGSKVGSGIWAADKMWRTIGEHYCVEESSHMNTIAQLLLQDGNEQKMVSSISGVHFRQFIPSPKEHKFSMVVCAYMLIEKPDQADRFRLLLDLWEMTETYLVLIENGTGAGFSLINEAKEFLLQKSEEPTKSVLPGHVFAPCPHDKSCPKLRDKNQPCLTESVLKDIDFTSMKLSEKPVGHVRYSYVILKKGPRVKDTEWPRVLHPIRAKGHVHIHACLPCGELQHVVISRSKFEKHLYSCAKYVEQGERLPISLSSLPVIPSVETTDTALSEDSSSDTDGCVEKDFDKVEVNADRK